MWFSLRQSGRFHLFVADFSPDRRKIGHKNNTVPCCRSLKTMVDAASALRSNI